MHEVSSPLPHREGQGDRLLIIGAGPGGYRAAELAAKHGLQVVIVEQDQVGGTCLNVGCIPTKCYVHSTTFEEARERVAQVVPQLRQGVEGILSHPNITLLRGHAEFVSANEVIVLPLQGESEGVRVTASNQTQATAPARHQQPARRHLHRTAAAGHPAQETLHHRSRRHRHGVCLRVPPLRLRGDRH